MKIFALDYTQPCPGLVSRDAAVFYEDFRQMCERLTPRQLRDWLASDVMILVLAMFTAPTLLRNLVAEPLVGHFSRGYLRILVDRLLKRRASETIVRDLFALHPLALRVYSDTLLATLSEEYATWQDQVLYLRWGLPIRFYGTLIRAYTLTTAAQGLALSFEVPLLYRDRHTRTFRMTLGRTSRRSGLVAFPPAGGAAITSLQPHLCRDLVTLCLAYVPF